MKSVCHFKVLLIILVCKTSWSVLAICYNVMLKWMCLQILTLQWTHWTTEWMSTLISGPKMLLLLLQFSVLHLEFLPIKVKMIKEFIKGLTSNASGWLLTRLYTVSRCTHNIVSVKFDPIISHILCTTIYPHSALIIACVFYLNGDTKVISVFNSGN